MRLTKLHLMNFLSYEDQVFDDLEKPGLVLLEGKNLDNPAFEANGAGKSAVWDAVAWCLFGETLRGIKAEEVQRRGASGCEVAVWLEHAGVPYVIRRARIKGSPAIEVRKDGTLVTLGTIPLTQALIERELGIDLELFRCTTVFAQGETFNFVDATDKAQKDILGRIMRLKLDDALQRARAAVTVSRETLQRTQEQATLKRGGLNPAQIASLADAIQGWEAERNDRKAAVLKTIHAATLEVEEWDQGAERRLQAARADVTRANAQVTLWKRAHEGRYVEQRAKIATRLDQLQQADAEHANEEALRAMEPRLQHIVTEAQDFVVRARTHRGQCETALVLVQTRLKALTEVEGHASCPTCLQTVDGALLVAEAKKLLQQQLDEEEALKRAQADEARTEVVLTAQQETQRRLREKLQEIENYQRKTRPVLQSYLQHEQQLAKQVEGEQNPNVALVSIAEEAVRRLGEEVNPHAAAEAAAKVAAQQVEMETNPHRHRHEAEVRAQALCQLQLDDLEKQVREQVGALAYQEFWIQGFGDQGMKSLAFDLVCSTLTEKANQYASLLTGGAVAVVFSTQKKLKNGETRERFDCEVLVDGQRVSYAAYSGGEKRRVSLAVDLALSDLMVDYYGSDFSLVVYDEQDQHMDGVGRRHYLKLLQEIARKKRVFVVAHDAVFKSMFDHVWTIEKRGGVSKLAGVV